MTFQDLYDELNYVDHSREKRAYYAQLILAHPELMEYVLDILFMIDDERSNRAGWLAEFAVRNNIEIIYPHLDHFTNHMGTVYKDAAVRPVAKISEYLALSYDKEQNPLTRKHLQSHHRSQIIETGFDWMITDQKVAVKAYTMTTLFHLGKDMDWVHPELERIMDSGYYQGSAAYKARVRHTKRNLEIYRKETSKSDKYS